MYSQFYVQKCKDLSLYSRHSNPYPTWFNPSTQTNRLSWWVWSGCHNSSYHVNTICQMLREYRGRPRSLTHYFVCVCVCVCGRIVMYQSFSHVYFIHIAIRADSLLCRSCVTDAGVGHGRSGEVSHHHPELLPQRSWRHHRLRHHKAHHLWLRDSLDKGGGTLRSD